MHHMYPLLPIQHVAPRRIKDCDLSSEGMNPVRISRSDILVDSEMTAAVALRTMASHITRKVGIESRPREHRIPEARNMEGKERKPVSIDAIQACADVSPRKAAEKRQCMSPMAEHTPAEPDGPRKDKVRRYMQPQDASSLVQRIVKNADEPNESNTDVLGPCCTDFWSPMDQHVLSGLAFVDRVVDLSYSPSEDGHGNSEECFGEQVVDSFPHEVLARSMQEAEEIKGAPLDDDEISIILNAQVYNTVSQQLRSRGRKKAAARPPGTTESTFEISTVASEDTSLERIQDDSFTNSILPPPTRLFADGDSSRTRRERDEPDTRPFSHRERRDTTGCKLQPTKKHVSVSGIAVETKSVATLVACSAIQPRKNVSSKLLRCNGPATAQHDATLSSIASHDVETSGLPYANVLHPGSGSWSSIGSREDCTHHHPSTTVTCPSTDCEGRLATAAASPLSISTDGTLIVSPDDVFVPGDDLISSSDRKRNVFTGGGASHNESDTGGLGTAPAGFGVEWANPLTTLLGSIRSLVFGSTQAAPPFSDNGNSSPTGGAAGYEESKLLTTKASYGNSSPTGEAAGYEESKVLTTKASSSYQNALGSSSERETPMQVSLPKPIRGPKLDLAHQSNAIPSPNSHSGFQRDISGFEAAFTSHEEFLGYFDSRVNMMRTYLCLYTTRPTDLNSDVGAMYHQRVKGVTDEEIPKHFYRMFSFQDFLMKDGKLEVNPSRVASVKCVIEQLLTELEPRARKAKAYCDGLRLRLKGANDHHRLVHQKELPRVVRALNYVHSRRSNLKNFTADGGKTNGEFTFGSLMKLFDAMEKQGVNSSDCLVDCGAAYGFWIWFATQRFQCTGYGIEIEYERSRIAAEQAIGIIQDEHSDVLYHTEVGFYSCDLYSVTHFPYCSVAFLFDTVMEDDLAAHTYVALAANPRLWMIVAAKPRKKLRLANTLSNLGFWCATTVPCSMTISGEIHTMGIYIRRTDILRSGSFYTDAEWSPVDKDLLNTMQQMLFSGEGPRLRAYDALLNEVNAIQWEIKRRRKTYDRKQECTGNPFCCRRNDNFECMRDCRQCEFRFAHHADSVIEQPSSIHGTGLFAATDIVPDTYLVRLHGRWMPNLPKNSSEIKRTMVLAYRRTGGGYFVADTAESMPNINHVCEKPNCAIIRWSDRCGADQFSIVATRPILKGQELTCNYGYCLTSMGVGNCACPSCSKLRICNILLPGKMYCDIGNREVAELVAAKKWTSAQGSDLNRIIGMEKLHRDVMVFTASDSDGSNCRLDRHICSNVREEHWLGDVATFLGSIGHSPSNFFQFCIWDDQDSVMLDDTICRTHIPGLARFLVENGSILLPCNEHVVKKMSQHEQAWNESYMLEFVSKHDKDINPLWEATNALQEGAFFGEKPFLLSEGGIDKSFVKGLRETCDPPFGGLVCRLDQMTSPEVKQISYLRLVKKIS